MKKILSVFGVLSMLVGLAAASSDLADVRKATVQYHDYMEAENDGYVNTHDVVSSPDGTMGVHFVNPALMADGVIDPMQPETLMYSPQKNGRYRLIGVEYMIVAADVQETPMLFGREFDGPMPGHGPDMPEHYDLHVWLWQANPAGMFKEWNSHIQLPAEE